MKLHILNDLHIEFEAFAPLSTDADVIVLAGDIGVGMEGLRWMEARFAETPVIYGTRVLCNPRGYAPRALNPDFKADLVVEVSP